VQALVRKRPLLIFFVLANAVSWLAWTPYILSRNGLGIWDYAFPEILGSSQIGLLPGLYLGPMGSAFLVLAIAEGRKGVRQWLARMWRWRVRPAWYIVTLLGVPAIMLIGGFALGGGEVRAPSVAALAAYLPVLLIQLITTGLGEEPGWRDFALPRLQQQRGAARACLILGPLWALWHMPLFLTEWCGWPDAHWSRPLLFFVFCVTFNVVMSWVFNCTGESLPMSMLAHCSVNTVASVLWEQMFPQLHAESALLDMTIIATVAAGVLLIATRGKLGYSGSGPDSRPRIRSSAP